MHTPYKFIPLLFLLLLSACELEEFSPAIQEDETSQTSGRTGALTMLDLANQLRREGCRCGSYDLPPVAALTLNSDLNKAALRHADDMATNDFFDHTGSDGTVVADRVSDTGYSWQTVGENIAWGYTEVSAVFEGWKDSPGHCRNLMNPHFTHMGMARVNKYWVQTFARPRSF